MKLASLPVSSFRHRSSTVIRSCLLTSKANNHQLTGHSTFLHFSFSIVPRLRSISCHARRNESGRPVTGPSKKNSKSRNEKDSKIREDDLDEDAFEALFKQLEEDLKSDGSIDDDNCNEITEVDLALFEQELSEALAEDEDMAELLDTTVDVVEEGGETRGERALEDRIEDVDDLEDEEEEEEEQVKLKSWQLRRLAHALKVGRRKTSIKHLADEVCLDRTVVLELLRDPPPNLLMMSATLPDKPDDVVPTITTEAVECGPSDRMAEPVWRESKMKIPIHGLQPAWSAQKRLKKFQVETLERVYQRSKRPTNALISSVVHVTNLPRKRVLKWFEDRRSEEGVPEERRPFQRSVTNDQ